MENPKWMHLESILAIHDEQLVAHGGKDGVRDEGLLESALGRPHHLAAYGQPDIFDLAASYAFGIVNDHPFLDGNKRTGFLVAYTFLFVNGWKLRADEADAYMVVMALAQKEINETAFAAWLRIHSQKREIEVKK